MDSFQVKTLGLRRGRSGVNEYGVNMGPENDADERKQRKSEGERREQMRQEHVRYLYEFVVVAASGIKKQRATYR